jgi:formylmethanofuran dehydrogenase subunit B
MRTVEDVACLGCGCTCDDIALVITDDRIVEARNACAMGVAWFGDGAAPARARKAGLDCRLDEAVEAIARMLQTASAPLIYLEPDVTCEAQGEAVALADLLRGGIDSVTSHAALASVLASQTRGRATATLGEVRNRADLLVFWGVDPALRYPRFETRYAPQPRGIHLPDGRRSRTVVAVDVGEGRGPADADVRVTIAPEDEASVLVALTSVLSTPSSASGLLLPSATLAPTRELASRISSARYAAIVTEIDHVPSSPGDQQRRAEALTLLSLAVNDATRGALLSLRGGGNRAGADAVLTSQTGFPLAVDFSRGYPRYQPWAGTASQRLSRGDIDAVLVLGAVTGIPSSVTSMLPREATCVIGPHASESVLSRGAAIIDTGLPSLHEEGTVLRMDDVPLPVRRRISGPPSTQTITRALRERIVASAGRRAS